MSKKIQTAIIGYGKSAKTFHVPLLKRSPEFEVRSVLQRTRSDSRDDFRDVNIVRNLKDLLKDDCIDLVIITTPNHLHFEQTFEALIADKHVVVEKPFTMTSDEAEKLIRLAQTKRRILTVYQNRRWDGDFLTIRELLHKKVIGKPVEFISAFDRFRNYFSKGSWKEKEQPGSGILYDLAPHLIDQALLLFGKPEKVYADIRAQRDGDADDYFEIDLYYPGLKAKLKAGMLVPEGSPRFILRGKNGSFVKHGKDLQEQALIDRGDPSSDDWGKEPESNWGILYKSDKANIVREKVETVRGNYLKFYEMLAYAILNKTDPPVNPDTSREGIKLIEAAIRSHETGCLAEINQG
jgi:scyllo-inositol 2-dehydrogenase (NADP+)